VRIHPIRAVREERLHHLEHLYCGVPRHVRDCGCRNPIDHEVLEPTPCVPLPWPVVVEESPEARAFAEWLRTGNLLRPPVSLIPTILLRLAIAGFLPRQRNFDWQILHGNWMHQKEERGQSLDTLV
jgi:hypothetical protein